MTYTGHGHWIPGTAVIPLEQQPKSRAECGGPGACRYCALDSAKELARIVSSFDLHDTVDVTIDSESVLFTVHKALVHSGLNKQQAINAIREIQNEGILFRRRL
jgi:hypothetical protein